MAELKCPHCGQAFTVDDTELSSIVKQIRDAEFERDLNKRINELEEHMQEKHELELKTKLAEAEVAKSDKFEKEKDKLNKDVQKLESEKSKLEAKIQKLEAALDSSEDKKQIAVMEAVKEAEDKTHDLEKDLLNEKENTKVLLAEKDAQIEFYKDLKTKMSTKMICETL